MPIVFIGHGTPMSAIKDNPFTDSWSVLGHTLPAAHHGHEEVVQYLLTTTIDVNQVNYPGWTALLEAIILGDGGPIYQRIIERLVRVGADMSLADNMGVTPLQHAKKSAAIPPLQPY